MRISRLSLLFAMCRRFTRTGPVMQRKPTTSTKTGGILPKPEQPRFSLVRIIAVVVPGVLIGAAISKRIAHFLDDNELFMRTFDYDDDD